MFFSPTTTNKNSGNFQKKRNPWLSEIPYILVVFTQKLEILMTAMCLYLSIQHFGRPVLIVAAMQIVWLVFSSRGRQPVNSTGMTDSGWAL